MASLAVPPELQRGAHESREEWLESGRFAVELLLEATERGDLSEVDLLDMGCGTKLVKTILDGGLEIGSYTGVDVSPEVIDWLEANVDDTRFEFHHLDVENAMYRPGGAPLASFEHLPTGPRLFEAICLFSVFTHLAPLDFTAMLRLLRRHAAPGATLLFSLYLEDPDHEAALESGIAEMLGSADPAVIEAANAAISERMRQLDAQPDRRFVDEVPDEPLAVARYQEDYAVELVEAEGWEILEIRLPVKPHIQHHMICRPAGAL